jgi:hypothetical protein
MENDGATGIKDVGKEVIDGRRESSGLSFESESGKGYSKRGDESKGVPRMEEGECRDKSARLRRGLIVELPWSGGTCFNVTSFVTAPTPSPVTTGTSSMSSSSGSGVGLAEDSRTSVIVATITSPSREESGLRVHGFVGIEEYDQ